MSNIILTPTHIACDHLFVDLIYNHKTSIDTNRLKIIFSPDNQFCVAAYGDCDYNEIKNKNSMDIIKIILKKLYEWKDLANISSGYSFPKDDKLTSTLMVWFGYGLDSFLITKDVRFVISHISSENKFIARFCDEYASVGTGRDIALGLLDTGLPIPEIYKTLNTYTTVVSEECSIFDLSNLEPIDFTSVNEDSSAEGNAE